MALPKKLDHGCWQVSDGESRRRSRKQEQTWGLGWRGQLVGSVLLLVLGGNLARQAGLDVGVEPGAELLHADLVEVHGQLLLQLLKVLV